MVAITPEEGMQSSLILANRIKDTVAGKRVVICDDFVTSIIFSEQLSFQTIGLSDRWRQNEDCQFILILAK